MKQFVMLFSLGVFAISCKTAKNMTTESVENVTEILTKDEAKTKNKAINEIATAHYHLFNDFNTLKINGNVTYEDQNGSYAPTAEIQMEKGKQILISIKYFGISGAKVYLTPERASYYEVLGGTYYDGTYQFISDMLGTEVRFENVENLLLGKAFYNLNRYDYTKEKNDQLALKLNQFLVKLILGTRNEIVSTEVTQQKSADKFVISYPSYQTATNLFLPKEINIQAFQKNDIHIKIDYRKINVNPLLDFRYKIPNNSKEIKI
ncbi:MAG TPA: DUF4292 domain-containing protein [Flavobacterium sp.]|nr:DUF4292 domain-containing protein [Flavobacterium sp.]